MIPDRGDIVWFNFNDILGHEQAGHRPSLVLSKRAYHERSSLITVCPITTNIQPWPWKVMLPSHSAVSGAILTDQLRTLDRNARELKIVGRVTDTILQQVSDNLNLLIMG